jgi:hypothetical protein
LITSTQVIDAIQARLIGDAGITALVPSTSIGNFLPQDNSFPHIFYAVDFETMPIKGETALEVTLQIDTYSKGSGAYNTLQISDAIQTALDGVPITIASGDCFSTQLISFKPELEADGKTYLGTLIYTLKYGDS